MGLTRSSEPLNESELKESLMLLDPSLDKKKALKLAKDVLKGKEKLEIKELIEILGCPLGILIKKISKTILEYGHETSDWYHAQLLKIKKNIKDPKLLRKIFEVLNIILIYKGNRNMTGEIKEF